MKTAEVWRFPLEDGRDGLLRVVLALKDLELRPNQLLSFLGDWLLIQISAESSVNEDSFDRNNLLFDGVLVYRYRNAVKLGFSKVATKPLSIDEVEFPGWFADDTKSPTFFRGELEYPVRDFSWDHVYNNWRILLSANSPRLEELPWLVSDYSDYLRSIREGNVKKGMGIYRHDVRYNVKRDEILDDIGVSFAEAYCRVLASVYGEKHLKSYYSAIDAV
jgi:hypothetical protein